VAECYRWDGSAKPKRTRWEYGRVAKVATNNSVESENNREVRQWQTLPSGARPEDANTRMKGSSTSVDGQSATANTSEQSTE